MRTQQLAIISVSILAVIAVASSFAFASSHNDLPSCSSLEQSGNIQLGAKCVSAYGEVFSWAGTSVFAGGAWKDSTGLTWSAHENGANTDPDSLSVDQAKKVCADLHARLPSQKELVRADGKNFFHDPLDTRSNSIFWTNEASTDYNDRPCTFFVDIIEHIAVCLHSQNFGAAYCVK